MCEVAASLRLNFDFLQRTTNKRSRQRETKRKSYADKEKANIKKPKKKKISENHRCSNFTWLEWWRGARSTSNRNGHIQLIIMCHLEKFEIRFGNTALQKSVVGPHENDDDESHTHSGTELQLTLSRISFAKLLCTLIYDQVWTLLTICILVASSTASVPRVDISTDFTTPNEPWMPFYIYPTHTLSGR